MRTALYALAATILNTAAHAEPGDATRGETVYERCVGCHSPDANRIGPMHRGVVGRVAGSVPGFAYSPALKEAGFVWTEALLDRWLTGPKDMIPGVRMAFSVNDPQDRADVIAYLKTLNRKSVSPSN